jgi:hypothetical protein
VCQFLCQHLVAVRNEMLGEVREQQPSQVFWHTLLDLIEHREVILNQYDHGNGHVIGKRSTQHGDLFLVSTNLALGAVQEALRRQGRPLLQITEQTLLEQLCADGRLLNGQGQALTPDSSESPTQQVRVNGQRVRCFVIRPPSQHDQL